MGSADMTTVNYIIDNKVVNKLTTERKWLDSYIPTIAKYIEKEGINIVFDVDSDFDLIHIHVPLTKAYFLSRRNNNGNHKPVIFHGHMTEDTFPIGSQLRFIIRKWIKKIARESDLILCPSLSTERYFKEHFPEKNIKQLNYGINLDNYAYSHEDGINFRRRYRIGTKETVVCCVGGMTYRKGIDEFYEIARRFPDIRFMWIGGLFFRNQHIYKIYNKIDRNSINIHDLPDNVISTGYTTHISAALSASDIFFFPSRQETQGLALVEAAANNRAIVTRDLPVFKEWLTHGHDCLMGACLDDFAEHIQTIEEDKALAIRLGGEAERSAKKYHDVNKTAESLARIYEELLR
jgi:1,2-diacylglycerol-3-alpha-glucose alpha-1,2-glucosyltransferase